MGKKEKIVIIVCAAITALALAGGIFAIVLGVKAQKQALTLEASLKKTTEMVKKVEQKQQEMAKDVKENNELSGVLTNIYFKPLDFTVTTSQEITARGKFLVTVKEVTQQMTGVKVTGRIINTASVQYTSSTFRIRIGGSQNTFTINEKMRAGGSEEFSVYVPDVKPADATHGFIEYVSGNISYYQ